MFTCLLCNGEVKIQEEIDMESIDVLLPHNVHYYYVCCFNCDLWGMVKVSHKNETCFESLDWKFDGVK